MQNKKETFILVGHSKEYVYISFLPLFVTRLVAPYVTLAKTATVHPNMKRLTNLSILEAIHKNGVSVHDYQDANEHQLVAWLSL